MKTAKILFSMVLAVFLMPGQRALGQTSPWTESGGAVYPTTLSNKVGIGTATPSSTLTVEGGFTLQNATDPDKRLLVGYNSTNNGYIYLSPFDIGAGQWIDLFLGERVGISVTNAGSLTHALTVGGDIFAEAVTVDGLIESTDDGFKFPDGTVQTTATPWITSGNDIYYESGNVGVGITNPTRKLHVFDDQPAGGSFLEAARVERTFSNSSTASQTGLTGQVDFTGSSTANIIGAVDGVARHSGTGTVTDARGITSTIWLNSSGTITDARSLLVNFANTGGGTIQTGYGIYMTDVLASTGYGLYQMGADDINYLAGSVGIGTTAPSAPLELAGTANPLMKLTSSGAGLPRIYLDNTNTATKFVVDVNQVGVFRISIEGSGVQEFAIAPTGNVGIGTPGPAHKLSVNGDIGAEEVMVVPNVMIIPDFVFEDDYALRSLEEVEQYIEAHGHLPEIPSAAEMQAEGVGLSAMQMKLLQKIEELTLYLIEQHKTLVELQQENVQLRTRMAPLETIGN